MTTEGATLAGVTGGTCADIGFDATEEADTVSKLLEESSECGGVLEPLSVGGVSGGVSGTEVGFGAKVGSDLRTVLRNVSGSG